MSDPKPIMAGLPRTAASHFNLYYYTAVLDLCEPVAAYYGSIEAALNEFPFLQDYLAELAGLGLVGQEFDQASESWYQALADWEAGVREFLPLRALQEAAGLERKDLSLLLTAGLGEEDPRFGELFGAMQGDALGATPGLRRPTFGLLGQWWRSKDGHDGVLPRYEAHGNGDGGSQAATGSDRVAMRPAGIGARESRRLPAESLRQLVELGLLEVSNPEAPRLEWVLQIPHLIWDALRGLAGLDSHKNTSFTGWASYTPPGELLRIEDLVLPDDLGGSLPGIQQLLASGEVQALVVRGQNHNGRHALLGALARQAGRGLLALDGRSLLAHGLPGDGSKPPVAAPAASWRLVGLMSTLLNAMPVAAFDLGPGETAEIPLLPGYAGPLGLVLPRQGGMTGPGVERALTITLEIPGENLRRLHWLRALRGSRKRDGGQHPARVDVKATRWHYQLVQGGHVTNLSRVGQVTNLSHIPGKDRDQEESFARRFRLTSGNIYRAARLAEAYAALRHHGAPGGSSSAQFEGNDGAVEEPKAIHAVALEDVQAACRALNRQALDTLATYIPAAGDWSVLVVDPDLRQELGELEIRCRQRERLQEVVSPALGAQLNAGVRALFSGASGTGKTLAARLLANALHMDLYRLDLSAVVNKYIGETEKNLNQVFARAEELDVILLLDEGDALLTQRTNVQSSNDRYANLETNYLLQRLDSFEGILIITTNAGDRIDKAFERRMDVVIHFRSPEVEERWGIWQIHLPASHTVDQDFLAEVVERCELSGGQIRNAALYASLLALEDGGVVTSTGLDAAVRREYRKIGAVCPLRDQHRLSPDWRS